MTRDSQAVTTLLMRWRGGDSRALDELVPIIYSELQRLAGRCLHSERPGHTLRATALVHEAYMRLVHVDVEWQDRTHFYAIAARVMRRILVEYARAHTRRKRGGGNIPIPLDEAVLVGPQAAAIVQDLDDALKRMAKIDARKSEILQLLFFGGLTYEETAAALHISPATVHRELKLAKAWLLREMEPRG
jgi:RNA polymerase sigma factor (TIGR02999 family)